MRSAGFYYGGYIAFALLTDQTGAGSLHIWILISGLDDLDHFDK